MRPRLKVLLLALAAVAAALEFAFVAGVRTEPPARGNSGPAAARGGSTDAPAGRAGTGSELPARPGLVNTGVDPFSTPAAAAAPGAPAEHGVAPSAAAPPLPYRFIGRVYQGGETQIFIARGPKVMAVKKGDVVDGEYRIGAVSGTELAFIHLRSGNRQVLQFTPPIEDKDRAAPDATARESAPPRTDLLNWNDTLTLVRRAYAGPARPE